MPAGDGGYCFEIVASHCIPTSAANVPGLEQPTRGSFVGEEQRDRSEAKQILATRPSAIRRPTNTPRDGCPRVAESDALSAGRQRSYRINRARAGKMR
jgi:hypothetical protein